MLKVAFLSETMLTVFFFLLELQILTLAGVEIIGFSDN